MAELAARKAEIESCKLSLEALYMDPKSDEDIQNNAEEQSKYMGVLTKADSHFTSWAGTLKSVKLAVETSLSL